MGMKKANLLGMMAMMAAMSNPEDYGTFEQKKPIKKPKKKFIGYTECFDKRILTKKIINVNNR